MDSLFPDDRVRRRRGIFGWWFWPGPARPPLAVSETIAVAVHLQNLNMMREPVEQRAGQPLGTDVHSSNGKLLMTIVAPRS